MSNPFMLLKITIIAAISLASFAVFAQQPSAFEIISTEQGLSQGMVFTIMQDKEGFLWIATKDGLNRYDGYEFKVFTNDPYDPWSLSNNSIRVVNEDSKGRIWAGMDNAGLNVYNKKTGRFHRIQHDDKDPGSLSSNRVKFIMEMPNGKMMVGMDNTGIDILDIPDDFFEKNTPPRITRLGFPDSTNNIKNIAIDKKDRIWISSFDRELFRFEAEHNRFTKVAENFDYSANIANQDGTMWVTPGPTLWDGASFSPLFVQPIDIVGGMTLHPDGSLWMISGRGLKACDISKWRPGHPLPVPDPWLFDNTDLGLQTFAIDHAGNIWVGTDGRGMLKMNLGRRHFQHLAVGFSIRHLLQTGKGKFLLGAYPVEWWSIENGKLDKDPLSWLDPNIDVDGILVASSGDYYVWSNAGFDRVNPVNRAMTKMPYLENYGEKQPMFEDSQGNIWLAGYNGSLNRFNPKNGKLTSFNYLKGGSMLPNLHSTAIYEDGQGTLWIGTEDGFVKATFNNGDESAFQFKWYRNNPNDRNSLNYNHVSCFLDDPADPVRYLWICTKGGGLNRLDKKTGDFQHLTAESSGLPNNVVYGILPDDAGNLWGSTNRGIFCLAVDHKNETLTGAFHNFTKKDGLQDDEFNTGAYAKLPDGELAFGGVNGLNIFNPKTVLTGGIEPKVYITDILVNSKPVFPGDESGVLTNTIETSESITLTHLQNILTLEFASLDFTNPSLNKYRYQLAGLDNDWVESGTQRSATFLHLAPGNYTFRVQGTNSRGIWSNHIASLNIKVLPPWWRTWWAYLVYLLLIAVAVREYFRFTINRTKLKEQLIYETKEAERIRELDVTKTRLYTNITHEFRTPLTVILGMANQVLENPTNYFRSGMEMIVRNGESLLNLVNEMLDLSKLESGKMSLNQVQGDVISFLKYLVESFQSFAEAQKKTLHFQTDLVDLHIEFDQEKLRQIVTNLLSNAVKFTPNGGNVYLSVSGHKPLDSKSGESDFNLLLQVVDTGIGIPAAHQEQVFDRFYQVDDSNTRLREGTGIGLALTKELVKLMGGEITVKSPPTNLDIGSEFTVILPVKICPKTAQPALFWKDQAPTDQFPVASADFHEEKDKELPLLLLVEDNADVVAYTASCLPNYQLIVGRNGQEGLELAVERTPDLIISDVMMPIMDGFELCQHLKSDERTSHIPIIMLTAKSDMESKLKGLEHGADAYLAKPFHKEELLVRIKKLLELRQQLQQVYLKTAGFSAQIISDELSQPEITEDAFVKKVREIVETNFHDPNFNVEQLCKEVFLSESQLQRKLDALTGCPPNRFIRNIRLKKSQEMLKNKDMTVSAVAFECGFNDPGYFAKVFKQEFGMKPLDYQKN